jgi:uncharacterized protein YycO
MAFDSKKVQVCDILLYRKKEKGDWLGDIIDLFSNGGSYTHGSLYVGNGEIIESHINSGVVKKKLNQEYYNNIDIYRVKNRLDKFQKDELISYMKDNEIGKRYDLAAFPSTWLRSSVAFVWGWKNFRKDRPLLNDDEHRFCTELVAASFKNALNIDICEGLHPNSTTPNDIGKSNRLVRIS